MQIDERQIVINRLKLSLSTKCLLSRFLDEYRNLMSVPKADECAMGHFRGQSRPSVFKLFIK